MDIRTRLAGPRTITSDLPVIPLSPISSLGQGPSHLSPCWAQLHPWVPRPAQDARKGWGFTGRHGASDLCPRNAVNQGEEVTAESAH